MKRLLITAALLTALGATTAALAVSGSSITEKVLGAAGISQGYTIRVTKPADVVVARATVPPGASFGWHYHRAAVIVVVKAGTLTLYDSADRTCAPQRYSAGQGFTERPHHVHLAATKAARRRVSSLSRPPRRQPRSARPEPGELPLLATRWTVGAEP